MDFLQFLNSKKKKPETEVVQEIEVIDNNDSHTMELVSHSIKKGDYVRIVFKKDSPLNIYKGYTGEIRDFRKGQDFAMVMLEAIASKQIIKFDIDHFYMLNF